VPDVRAVRVARLVGVGVVLAMVGDPVQRAASIAMLPMIANRYSMGRYVWNDRCVSIRW